MTLSKTLRKHLEDQGVGYEIVTHPRTLSASKTAQTAHVSGENIAKAVVLKRENGYLLAVLPATHHIQIDDLRDWLDEGVELAKEEEVAKIFADCDLGAIPPIGAAYGLDVVVEESLAGPGEVFFEGGDHTSLVRVTSEHFEKLMAKARRGRFSRHD